MSEITIRMLNEDDPERISKAFRKQGWEKPIDLYQRYLDKQKNGEQVSLVAEIDGDFAGYVNVVWQPAYPLFREHNTPEVQDFNVLIKHRRRGIGTMLMDKAEDIIRERSEIAGIRVGLFTDYGAAQVLYVKRGYVPDGKGIYQNDVYPQYGQQVLVDDDLVLSLIKKLK
jgi:ribosomal protein S18 acetylase RimI-like enzyme